MLVLKVNIDEVVNIEIPPSNKTRYMQVMRVRSHHIGFEADKEIRVVHERLTQEQENAK